MHISQNYSGFKYIILLYLLLRDCLKYVVKIT